MTWGTSSQPTFVAGQLGTYGLTSTGTTSTRLVYDIITPYTPWNSAVSGNGGGGNGLVFTFANNTITLHCNDSAAGDTDHPAVASNITTSGAAASSITVSEGDTVSLKISAGSSIGNFTVPTFTAASTTSTESVNVPYVTWNFPTHGCGLNTYVSVTHTEPQSSSTTYLVYQFGYGQIGTIIVGTGANSASGSGNFQFTVTDRTIQIINPAGSVIGSKAFSCDVKKVHGNFW